MTFSIIRFWLKGWIKTLYIDPKIHFSYLGFEWVKPFGEYTYILFFVCGLSSFFVAIGYRYLFSIIIFFLSFTYIELMDKTTYLNHYYFVSILSFLLIFLPANASHSLDNLLKKRKFISIPKWNIDSIKLLPNYKYRFGIINNSVGNLRGAPSHSSELVSQAVLGTKLKILKREGEWYLVQTPDDYISWIDHGGIHVMEESSFSNYFGTSYVYTDTYGFSYTDESRKNIVSDIVMGSELKVTGSRNNFYEVNYPDGRYALVEKNKLLNKKGFDRLKDDKDNLIKNSNKLIGIPYLWGGTSTKGFDCSGFTKTLYSMNGYTIPRDASQQINEGLTVDSSRVWSNLEVGDLLFFGYERDGRTRIDHVAMWVGDNKFIQASRNVRINSVDEESKDYDEYHMKKYILSKRYLGNISDGIKDL